MTWQLGRTTLVALDDTVVRPGSEAVFCRCIPAPRGTTRVTELTGRNAAQNDTAARLVIAHIPGRASGTTTVTVGDRDIERLEAENAPVYVPIPDGLGDGWRLMF